MVRKIGRRQVLEQTAGVLAALGMVGASARAAQFSWKFAHAFQLSSPQHLRSVEMATAIRTESGGRLDIQVFGNSELGGDTSTLVQVRSGAIHLVAMIGGTYGSIVPVASVDELGFAFRNIREARAALDGALGAYIAKELAVKGLVMLKGTVDYGGFRQMCSASHPIARAEDLVNFKVRTPPSKISVDLFRALGASPSPINVAEAYTALQTHNIDGIEIPFVVIDAGKFYEVVKYVSLTNHQYTADYLCANPDAWNALPPDIQAIVQRASVRYAEAVRQDSDALNASLKEGLIRRGMIMNEIDMQPFRASLASYYAYWKDAFGTTAWSILEGVTGKLR